MCDQNRLAPGKVCKTDAQINNAIESKGIILSLAVASNYFDVIDSQ